MPMRKIYTFLAVALVFSVLQAMAELRPKNAGNVAAVKPKGGDAQILKWEMNPPKPGDKDYDAYIKFMNASSEIRNDAEKRLADQLPTETKSRIGIGEPVSSGDFATPSRNRIFGGVAATIPTNRTSGDVVNHSDHQPTNRISKPSAASESGFDLASITNAKGDDGASQSGKPLADANPGRPVSDGNIGEAQRDHKARVAALPEKLSDTADVPDHIKARIFSDLTKRFSDPTERALVKGAIEEYIRVQMHLRTKFGESPKIDDLVLEVTKMVNDVTGKTQALADARKQVDAERKAELEAEGRGDEFKPTDSSVTDPVTIIQNALAFYAANPGKLHVVSNKLETLLSPKSGDANPQAAIGFLNALHAYGGNFRDVSTVASLADAHRAGLTGFKALLAQAKLTDAQRKTLCESGCMEGAACGV